MTAEARELADSVCALLPPLEGETERARDLVRALVDAVLAHCQAGDGPGVYVERKEAEARVGILLDQWRDGQL